MNTIATHKITGTQKTRWGTDHMTRMIEIEISAATAGGYEQTEKFFRNAVMTSMSSYPAVSEYAADRRNEIGMEWSA